MSGITYFGQTDFRNEQKKFGIKDKDRLRHIYIIGKTGVGKSTMIENMIAQDIINGNGCAFLDPHGASAEKMLDYIPPHRVDDVVYFAPFDMAHPISFNVMEDVGPDKRHHVANGILSVMKKIWVDAFSGRMEYIVQNVLLALMETPGSTLLGINRMLADKEYRQMVIDNIQDPSVKSFWVDEYLKWDERYQREAGAAIQNKIGQFTSNPLIRNIVGQPKSSFDIRELMDNKKILIANFSKGLLGEQNARLLGSMLSTSIYLAAMSRAELDEEEMKNIPPFYLYVDEFQNFANDSFADVLSEARKYKLSLTMAHQYVAQMPDTVREAIFGNVGTMITFRIGPEDAEAFEREFSPTFMAPDFTNLGPYQIYLRLMIDGLNSSPFSARTLPPIPTPEVSMKLQAFQRSRQLYANNREQVQKAIEDWFIPIPSKKQLEHQEYLAKKKAEIEAKGGVWIDPSDDSRDQSRAKKETPPSKPKTPEGVYRKPVSTNPPKNTPSSTSSPVSGKPSAVEKKTNNTTPKKPRLGVEPALMAQNTRDQQKTNTQTLDDLLSPSEIKKQEYEKKKKLQEKMAQQNPKEKKEEPADDDDDLTSAITLSSNLKGLLDNLDEGEYDAPVRVQKEEVKKVSSPGNSQNNKNNENKNFKKDTNKKKLSYNERKDKEAKEKQKKNDSDLVKKERAQSNNTKNNKDKKNNTKNNSNNNQQKPKDTSPDAFKKPGTGLVLEKKIENKAAPTPQITKKDLQPQQQTREASQDSKKSLQEILARALQEKKEYQKQKEGRATLAKKEIPQIVTRAQQSPEDNLDDLVSLHKKDKTLAHTKTKAYTRDGIAPDTYEKKKSPDATDDVSVKKEASVDVLRDILGT